LLQAIAEGRAGELPLVKALRRKPGELKRQADRIKGKLTERLGDGYQLSVVPTKAMVGGGTLPQLELPSYAVLIQHRSKTPQELAEEFRRHKPPILGRILKEGFALDVFALLEGEERIIFEYWNN
jgi:L-seryl-tRNA(Ser) seleniumtransferase